MTDSSCTNGLSIDELLEKARREIDSGYSSMKAAAEYIAAAQEKGATQRTIANVLNKSPAWVNRLMKWRKGGYQDETPFGPQSKEARRRKVGVEATEQSEEEPWGSTVDKLLRTNPIWTPGPAARSEQASPAPSALHVSSRGKAQEEDHDTTVTGGRPGISGPRRRLLLEALDGLAASDPTERAQAASWVEQCRSALGLSWNELVVPADGPQRQIRPLDLSAGQVELAAHG